MDTLDTRRLLRGVVLQLLYELDTTTHTPTEVLQLTDNMVLVDPGVRMMAYIGLRVRHKAVIPAQHPKDLTIPLDKPAPDRTPLEQVITDYLLEGRDEEEAVGLSAEIEYQLIVQDVEEFDFHFRPSEDLMDGEDLQALHQMLRGIYDSREKMDSLIKRYAPEWEISQLAVVERNILRIAIYEMAITRQSPMRVAINEAVELAKIFGSESASRFVNGVLGAMANNFTDIVKEFKDKT